MPNFCLDKKELEKHSPSILILLVLWVNVLWNVLQTYFCYSLFGYFIILSLMIYECYLVDLITSPKFRFPKSVWYCLITFQVKWNSVGCFCSTHCWVHYCSVEFKVRIIQAWHVAFTWVFVCSHKCCIDVL